MTSTTTVATASEGGTDRDRLLGNYAVAAALVAALVTPLLGLAWFATSDGADALSSASVSWWADPARDALSPLLGWASPERVYSTYLQVVALLWPALLLTARHAVRRRPGRTRTERVAWRVMLTGYVLVQVGITWIAVYLVGGDPNSAAVDPPFLALMVPGMLLGTLGATTLGVSLLRGGWQPRGAAVLLALSWPFWFVVSFVLGHNGMGMLAMFVAWAVYARRVLLRP